jgi:hypothetical protein
VHIRSTVGPVQHTTTAHRAHLGMDLLYLFSPRTPSMKQLSSIDESSSLYTATACVQVRCDSIVYLSASKSAPLTCFVYAEPFQELRSRRCASPKLGSHEPSRNLVRASHLDPEDRARGWSSRNLICLRSLIAGTAKILGGRRRTMMRRATQVMLYYALPSMKSPSARTCWRACKNCMCDA